MVAFKLSEVLICSHSALPLLLPFQRLQSLDCERTSVRLILLEGHGKSWRIMEVMEYMEVAVKLGCLARFLWLIECRA